MKFSLYTLIILLLFSCSSPNAEEDTTVNVPEAASPMLPSWNNTPRKQAIIDFVEAVTAEGTASYVTPEDRIATFDNDGTLWAEQPTYFQLFFGMDMVKAMAGDHPEWQQDPVMKAAIEGDLNGVMSGGMEALAKIVFVSHGQMSTKEFNERANAWLDSARHPVTGKKYTEMVYQPMLELIDYLHANDFKVFIVSGGGIEFLRCLSPRVYGIPSERIVGSSLKLSFSADNSGATLMREPHLNFVDDKEGKPIGIQYHIGKRPIASFGNSDGDLQMHQWTEAGSGSRLMAYVHHTDGEREYAYDRGSHIGGFDAGLDSARNRGWTVIDMKSDWSRIYP